MTISLDGGYFDNLYAGNPDPWNFVASDYERDKYAATLAALPRPRFDSALEVGCSIGVFTRMLAVHCGRLLALDIADVALAQARTRCADHPQITFRRATVPREWPEGRFDLILLSEVLYFLAPADVAATARHAVTGLAEGGVILLVHWLGETDYPMTGEAAQNLFLATAGLRVMHAARTADYRLDLLAG